MTPEELVAQSIKALKETIDVEASYKVDLSDVADATIGIRFSRHGRTIEQEFSAEIKPTIVVRSMVGQLAFLQRQSTKPVLLVAKYVSPPVAEQLKELNIAFIDSVGNAYFNQPELLIYINSRTREKELGTSKTSILFQSSGLKLIFALLSIPGSENRTFRELAEMSGLSLGSISEIFANLQRDNYLVSRKEGRLLLRKDKLLQRWVQGYSEKLRPKLRKLSFQSNSDEWWETFDAAKIDCQWGGDVAADRMAAQLVPYSYTLYSKNLAKSLRAMVQNGYRRVLHGDIEILDRFWNFEHEDELVPPLLVYADLLATGNERNIEVAHNIHDKYLIRLAE